jgi:hypothetical protein
MVPVARSGPQHSGTFDARLRGYRAAATLSQRAILLRLPRRMPRTEGQSADLADIHVPFVHPLGARHEVAFLEGLS